MSAEPARGRVDLVVDVGNIRHKGDLMTLVREEARQQREDHERPGVADVDPAIDGRPAGVDAHVTGLLRIERSKAGGSRVVQGNGSQDRATLAPASESVGVASRRGRDV
jgi:hypothetical protein